MLEKTVENGYFHAFSPLKFKKFNTYDLELYFIMTVSIFFQKQSALMLTEVLKEREAQLELKRLQSLASEGKDKEWLDKARREHEEAIKLDQESAMDRIKAAKTNQNFLKAQ